MKIKDLLKDNKKFLSDQEKELEKRLQTYQVEANKIATELKETKKQIELIDKVSDFVDNIHKTEDPNDPGNGNGNDRGNNNHGV